MEAVEAGVLVSKENSESTGRRGGGRTAEIRVGCLVFRDLILSQSIQTCRILLGPTGVMAAQTQVHHKIVKIDYI